jgi:hypothetical protein
VAVFVKDAALMLSFSVGPFFISVLSCFLFLLFVPLSTFYATEDVFFAVDDRGVRCELASVRRDFSFAVLALDEFWLHFFTSSAAFFFL